MSEERGKKKWKKAKKKSSNNKLNGQGRGLKSNIETF